jgi:hypothetical protein
MEKNGIPKERPIKNRTTRIPEESKKRAKLKMLLARFDCDCSWIVLENAS